MKRFVTTISVFLISIGLSFGQTNDSVQKHNDNKSSELSIADTIKIQNIPPPKGKTTWFQGTNAPWVLALLISIAGLALNLIIANRQIRSNKEQQLKQIKATLNTNNRQEWITELRNTITELSASAKSLNMSFQLPSLFDKQFEIHNNFSTKLYKLMLLVKQNKPLHEALMNAVDDLVKLLDNHLFEMNNKQKGYESNFDNNKVLTKIGTVIKIGRDLLYDEWGRVQSIANEDDKKDNK